MDFNIKSIINPNPTDALIESKQVKWNIQFPKAFKEFIKHMNGVEVIDSCIKYNGISEKIERFFCILDDIKNENGYFDIGAISAPIIENLVYDEECIGIQVLPIAKLEYGNYIVLDYKDNLKEPCVCVYDRDVSDAFQPVTYYISSSFEEFIDSF